MGLRCQCAPLFRPTNTCVPTDLRTIKAIFEKAVEANRYSDRTVYDQAALLREWEPAKELQALLESFISAAECQVIHRRIVRAVYFIELVKADVTSTKYDVRWTNRFASGDPRAATFDDCCAINESVCREIHSLLADEVFRTEFALVVPWGLSPHEIPLDYDSKIVTPIHSSTNLHVLRDPNYSRLLKIRRALLDPKLNPDFQLFVGVFDKIRVKSYLTDRALTGGYKTNREKRWEAHPNSPQFAFRKDCLAIELALIEQLIHFQAFPSGTIRYLEGEKLISTERKVARCPVTLDPLDFELLAQEVADPTFGRSAYQVGHLNPLKAGEGDEFRHAPANISWITEDGNRIQGHLTLTQTRKLLLRISRNYEALIETGEISPP